MCYPKDHEDHGNHGDQSSIKLRTCGKHIMNPLQWLIRTCSIGKITLEDYRAFLLAIANGAELIRRFIKCDAIAVLLLFISMYIFGKFHYSRYIVLGSIILTVLFELLIFIGMYCALRFHKENKSFAIQG